MTHEERLEQINKLMPALQSPALAAYINETVASLTQSLINQNNEETRGRVKALRDLLTLPEALQQERKALTAALSEESDAAN